MFGKSRKNSLVYMIALFILGLLFAGCVQTSQDQDLPVDPFSARVEGDDGILVTWNGNSRGYHPGSDSTFNLEMSNTGQEAWRGEYCLILLDKNGVVTTFGQGDFNLQPGEGFSTSVQARFPEDLSESPYGLTLVIPGRLENSVTIYVGDARDKSVGGWPAQARCP